MSDERLAQLAAATALAHMMDKGWLDICTIDKCAKLLGRIPEIDAYRILSPLHCVNFNIMPDELRAAVPGLIARCLAIEWPPRVAPPEPEHAARRGVLRLLTRKAP